MKEKALPLREVGRLRFVTMFKAEGGGWMEICCKALTPPGMHAWLLNAISCGHVFDRRGGSSENVISKRKGTEKWGGCGPILCNPV